MAFDTGCHKCGGYPGAGGMKERAALYQCLKCGTYTCNNHLVGLVGRSCPACQNQKLKQVANKQSIAKRKKAETKMDKGGGGSSGKKNAKGGSKPEKQTVQEQTSGGSSGGGGGSFSGGESHNVKVSAVAVYKGKEDPNISEDIATQSIASLMARLQNSNQEKDGKSAQRTATIGLKAVDEGNVADINLSFGSFGDDSAPSSSGLGALEAALAAGAPPPTTNEKDLPSLAADKADSNAPKEQTGNQETAAVGFWAQQGSDEDKQKKLSAEHWHDALFELDEPKFFADSLAKLEKQYENKALACGVVALKLDTDDSANWLEQLKSFSQSQHPLVLSVICQQEHMPDDNVWEDINQNPALKALGPVKINNQRSPDEIDSYLQHVMAVALKHNWVLLLNLPVGLERSLKDLFTNFTDMGGQAILCGPKLDAVGLELVQELGFYLAVRPEYSYPDNEDSRDFLSCVDTESLVLATGSELNAPQAERGNFNSPKYLTQTARFAATTLDCELADLAKHLRRNWLALFVPKTDTE